MDICKMKAEVLHHLIVLTYHYAVLTQHYLLLPILFPLLFQFISPCYFLSIHTSMFEQKSMNSEN